VFRQLGARVVAVEPQAECIRELERQFATEDAVTIVPSGLASEAGSRRLFKSTESTLASMSPDFLDTVQDSGRFGDATWDEGAEVPTTTLDALIAEHGSPGFCKIDVEGLETDVLAGLSRPLAWVSFEFVAERPDAADACMTRLEALGDYRFNAVIGDTNRFHLEQWVSREELLPHLVSRTDRLWWGDVHARRAA
jgi:FkbM family methyltransferase